MAGRGQRPSYDSWTHFVRLARVVLPLAALALLSTVFFVARHLNPDDAIPYAKVDVADRMREPRMTLPVYSGATQDGADLRINADEALPEKPSQEKGPSAKTVFSTLTTPDGGRTELTSATAQMDSGQETVTFEGAVDVKNSTGYRVQTERMIARLDQTEVRSLTPVVATNDTTRITATEMVLTQDVGKAGSYVLVFNGDVKMVYQPQK